MELTDSAYTISSSIRTKNHVKLLSRFTTIRFGSALFAMKAERPAGFLRFRQRLHSAEYIENVFNLLIVLLDFPP
jgi:hypothetical protein